MGEILELKLRLIAFTLGAVRADRARLGLRSVDPSLIAEAMSRSRRLGFHHLVKSISGPFLLG